LLGLLLGLFLRFLLLPSAMNCTSGGSNGCPGSGITCNGAYCGASSRTARGTLYTSAARSFRSLCGLS
jgi:hypothetical protein